MQVRLVRQHELREVAWFKKHKGKVFTVREIQKGDYLVDLTPAGLAGCYGLMSKDEVEVVPEATS